MKMHRTVLLLAAALLGPAGLPARAHAGHMAELEKRFAAADRDHDGRLTPDEARAAGMSSVVRDFKRIDKDGKGYVTLEQLKARLLHKDD
jgi:hypothetical protein